MDEYEMSLQVMDDDGAGSAIGSSAHNGYVPDEQEARDLAQCHSAAQAASTGIPAELPDPVHHHDIFSRIEASDETSRIARAHEARFAALPQDEQVRQYDRFEQGTAGAWLGTYSS